MTMTIKRYSELVTLKDYESRFNYLRLDGDVGKETFGFDRIFNQQFYTSSDWKKIRRFVIIRDMGCDLGVDGHNIQGQKIVIHHMNPITLNDIEHHSDLLLNPEYLITTTHLTHLAIHYGNEEWSRKNFLIERRPNDTCPWKK